MRLAGYGGSVIYGSTTATGVKGWVLDYTYKVEDVRGFDDGINPNPLPTVMEWGGSLDAWKDGAPIPLNVQVALQLKESNATGQTCTGSAYFVGFHDSVVVDGVVAYTYDYVGKGTFYPPTA